MRSTFSEKVKSEITEDLSVFSATGESLFTDFDILFV